MVVVTDKLPKGRRGLCTANHGMLEPRLLPVYAHLYSIVTAGDEREDCTEICAMSGFYYRDCMGRVYSALHEHRGGNVVFDPSAEMGVSTAARIVLRDRIVRA